MTSRRRIWFLLGGVGLLPLGSPAQQSEDGPVERPVLVFRSDRGGGADGIWYKPLTEDGGGEARQLVSNERDVLHFALHPDGRQIAWVEDPRDIEAFDLRVRDLVTGAERAVYRGIRFAPAWSPNGARLAYSHHASGWWVRFSNPELAVARPEHRGIGGDIAPSWFPDGAKVAFQSNRTGRLEIFVADPRTGTATQLTDTTAAEVAPRVAPNGRWIAFTSGAAIGIVGCDGENWRLVVEGELPAADPTWSPDGRQLAFVRGRDAAREVCLVTIADDGSPTRVRPLVKNPMADHSPAWAPDGGSLAFVSKRDGNAEIYRVDADGSGLVRLTHDPGRDRSPAFWSMRR